MASRLKDMMRETPVHERQIEMRSYSLEDGRLIVEGRLKDEQLVPGYNWDGRSRSPGVVHWICVRLLVGGMPLSILDAEAEMPRVPNDLCHTTLEAVHRIIGLPITAGYSEKIREILGGVESCAHLAHLITTMGAAALHGYWAEQSRRPRPLPNSVDEFPGISNIMNSCKLWREDGPLVQNLRDTIRKKTEGER